MPSYDKVYETVPQVVPHTDKIPVTTTSTCFKILHHSHTLKSVSFQDIYGYPTLSLLKMMTKCLFPPKIHEKMLKSSEVKIPSFSLNLNIHHKKWMFV